LWYFDRKEDTKPWADMGAVKFQREWMKHHLIDDRLFYSSSLGVVIAGQEAVWSDVGAIESVQLKI
jgi:hypothetical protein